MIVIIGVLAAITIVAYTGISQQAGAAGLKSDLKQASTQLELAKAQSVDGNYPSNDSAIKKSNKTTFQYTLTGTNYCLSATNDTQAFHLDSSVGDIQDGVCTGHTPPSGGGGSGSGWKVVSTGNYHACAIDSNDKAYCWGDNYLGQLGINNTIDDVISIPSPVYTLGVLSGKTLKSIDSGYGYACAIASDDQAYCWGNNYRGQLGNNSTSNTSVPVAVDTSGVLSGKTMKSISVGMYQACVIASDNQAYCWGYNNNGQLGNNSTSNSSVPVAVDTSGVLSGKTIKSISTDRYNTCAIASDDQAYCWGANFGGLGNNSPTSSSTPLAVDTSGVLSGKTIKSISVGNDAVCVVTSDNKAYCWGDNSDGKLGNNSTTDSQVPVAVYAGGVLSGKNILSVSSGRYQTCAIASDNKAYCWGNNDYGAIGDGSNSSSSIPVAVDTSGVLSGKLISSISVGEDFVCAISSGGQAYCWGYNDDSELGNNSTAESDVPVAVSPKT